MQNFTKKLLSLLMLGMMVSFIGCKEEENLIPIPAEIPTIKSVSPAEGTVGTEITIRGTGFLNGADVKVGSQTATVVEVASDTVIYAQIPAGIEANVLLAVIIIKAAS